MHKTTLVLLAALASSPALAAEPMSADQKTLIGIEQEIAKALVAKDLKTLAAHSSKSWVIRSDGGSIPYPTYMSDIETGKVSIKAMKLQNLSVRVNGDSAYVLGEDVETSSYYGRDGSGHYSWLDVFERRGGKWQLVATQVTRLAK
jgi:ketosteroid isomerase-like protein